MFRREPLPAPLEQLASPIAELPISCLPDSCQLAGQLACREVTNDPEAYERIAEAAETFLTNHSGIEAQANTLKHNWFATVEEKQLGDRNARRFFRRTKEQQFLDFSHGEQQLLDVTLTNQLQPNWEGLPLGLKDSKSSKDFFGNLQKRAQPPHHKPGQWNHERIELYNMHHRLAIAQLRVRGELAIFCTEAPEAARELFDPRNLENLPLALQHLVAVDISRGEHSVILNHQQTLDDTQRSSLSVAERLAEYLAGNGLPKEIKAFFQAIQIGAATMGAATCPFNELGLCTRVLQRIQLSHLPPQLLADMERKEQFASRTNRLRLQQFANDYPLGLLSPSPKMVGMHEPVNTSETETSTKRRLHLADSSTSHPSVAEPETAPGLLQEIQVQLPGEPLLTLDPSDSKMLETVLSQLLESKLVSQYMRKHNFDGMGAFMRQCLLTILLPSDQREGNGIKPLTDAKPAYLQGEALRVYELAVHQYRGLQGNKIARHTRIFFAQGGSAETRKVLMLDIAQKESAKKRNLTRMQR